jgi:hypothetical protein
VSPQSGTAVSVAASSVPMFPCAEEPAAAGRQAYWRNDSTVARVAVAVAAGGGETLDRSPTHAFAGRAAADGTGSTIAQNDGLAPAASMAWGPRTHAAASIHIALGAQADIPAVALDILVVAMEVDIPAAVRIDSAVALRAGLTFAPDDLVANGWALDDGKGEQSSGCDGPERETAPSPRSA